MLADCLDTGISFSPSAGIQYGSMWLLLPLHFMDINQQPFYSWLKMQDQKTKDQKGTKDVSTGPENAGPIMQGWKMQDWKMWTEIAAMENAGPN